MTGITEISATGRKLLLPLFEHCPYDRVLIDSVLEGHFGSAYADSAQQPCVARLDSGAFTLLGGDSSSAAVEALLHLAPVEIVTPQNEGWRQRLEDEFGERISILPFTDFSPVSLSPSHLRHLLTMLPPGFDLRPIDAALAARLPDEIGNTYFFENFQSIEDFLARGLGYAILHQGRIVSAATSMARSSKAIDIEIETVADYRRRGLGTLAGARLITHCLEAGIEPRWLAANPESEALALKLGYTHSDQYETFLIE